MSNLVFYQPPHHLPFRDNTAKSFKVKNISSKRNHNLLFNMLMMLVNEHKPLAQWEPGETVVPSTPVPWLEVVLHLHHWQTLHESGLLTGKKPANEINLKIDIRIMCIHHHS